MVLAAALGFGFYKNQAQALPPGFGSEGNPYRLSTCSQLAELDGRSGHFILTDNIYCDGVTVNPISTFPGTLDGRNYTIHDMTISQPSGDAIGFINWMNGGTIKNVRFTNISITGRNYVGLIAQTNPAATLENVQVDGEVSGNIAVGGLMGIATNSSVINKSSFTGDVTATTQTVGGLVGQGIVMSITDSYAQANVTGPAKVGGLVGQLDGTGGYGVVDRSYFAGSVTGDNFVGGMIGFAGSGGTSAVSLTDSFIAATVTANESTPSALYGAIDSGIGTAAITNIVYDNTGVTHCGAGGAVGGCDGLVGSDTFKGLTIGSQQPFHTSDSIDDNEWDLSNIWQPQTGDFPSLRTPGLDPLPDPTAPAAPTGVSVGMDGSLVGISWDYVDDGGSAITGIRLEYRQQGTTEWEVFDTVNDGTSDAWPLINFSAGGTFEFRVTASNAVGMGDPSDIATFDTPKTEIETCEDLQNIEDNPQLDYVLVQDIDCSMTNPDSDNFDPEGPWADGQGFFPIESFTGELRSDLFHGHYSITGLYINRDSYGSALFYDTDGDAEISGITIEDADVTGIGESAILVAYAYDNTYIQDVDVSGTVNSTYSGGGMIGNAYPGDNHQIAVVDSSVDVNLRISEEDTPYDWGGLAGYVYTQQGSFISSNNNIEVNMSVTLDGNSSYDFGGVIGYLESYDYSYVLFEDTNVSGYEGCYVDCGGLVGYLYADASSDANLEVSSFNTKVEMDIEAGIEAGGLYGYLYANNSNISIEQTSFVGSVSGGAGDNVGGLIAKFDDDGDNSQLSIIRSYARADLLGQSLVGGLVGEGYVTGGDGGSQFYLEDSYAQVNITGDNYLGGLVGGGNPMIVNSYAAGDIDSTDGYVIGGLAGELAEGGSIADSFAAVSINATLPTTVGGLVGANGGNVYNSYVDADISDPGCNTTYGGDSGELDYDCIEITGEPNYFLDNSENQPFGYTDEEDAFVPVWDFDEVWSAVEADYPQFQWDQHSDPLDSQISTCEQLQEAAYHPHQDFELANDIDCSMTNPDNENWDAEGTWGDERGFRPIGDQDQPYTGEFVGNGYAVMGLYIDRTDEDNIGLFGYTEGAEIIDIHVDSTNSDVGIYGGTNTGGVVGFASNTDLSYVSTVGFIYSAGENAGGVVGYMTDGSSIYSAYSTGYVIADNQTAGGLIGLAEFSNIFNTYSWAFTYSDSYNAGGLIGASSYIYVYSSYASGNIYGEIFVGGLIGFNTNESTYANVFSASVANDGVFPEDESGAAFNGLVGYDPGAEGIFENAFYNSDNFDYCEAAGPGAQGDPDGCAGISGGEDTMYWKANTEARPFTDGDDPPVLTWDFDDAWATNYDNFPTLRPNSEPYYLCNEANVTDTTVQGACQIMPFGWGTTTWEARYKKVGDSSYTDVDLDDTHSANATISGLLPGTEYYLEFRATNSSGISTWARVEATTTGSASPDSDSDGVADADENAGPNDGDANHDGTPDSEQASVVSFVSDITHKYVVMQTACDTTTNVQLGRESADDSDSGFDYPVGLIGFIGTGCGEAGSDVTVTQIFYGDYDADSFEARKWINNTYMSIDDAEVSEVTIGGHSAMKVTYQVKDGGSLDDDGQADSNIVDPSGPGVSVVGAPNTGLGPI